MFFLFQKYNKRRPLSEEERIAYLQSLKVDKSVLTYLTQLLTGLNIDVMTLYEGKILDLMSQNKLIGWCWQTAETSSLFFDDNDFIERGYLILDPHRKDYFHSWVVFTFQGKQYVFDPCLNILCKKEEFYRVFEIKTIKARVKAGTIKDTLRKRIYFSNGVDDITNCELMVPGTEDVNGPFFRGTRKYTVDIEKKKLLKLNARYYDINY